MAGWRERVGATWKRVQQARRAADMRRRCAAAQRVRSASKARFIGITGSSAKTTTTALLAHVLAGEDRVTAQVDRNTLRMTAGTLARMTADPRWCVVEAAAGGPGTVASQARLLRPDVAIVTLVGIEHYSKFRTREAVALEKGSLVEAVEPGGYALLNADDPFVAAMAARTAQRIVSFGRMSEADYRAVDVTADFPDRLALSVRWRGGEHRIATNLVGEHFWLSAVAAFAAAVEEGLSPEQVIGRIATFEPVPGRMSQIAIPGGPTLLLDIKAPWETVGLALAAVKRARAPRKTIVLGTMSDYPGSTRKYARVYREAAAAADRVIFVGPHAHRSEASAAERADGRFVEIRQLEAALDFLRRSAVPGELILIKSAPGLHIERLVLGWAGGVRCWVESCGKEEDCMQCGFHPVPFEEQRRTRGRRRWLKRWRKFKRRFGYRGDDDGRSRGSRLGEGQATQP